MSTLVVLGYKTEDEAKNAYSEILNLSDDLIVNLQSIAVIARRENGKYDIVTPDKPVGTSTVWGLFWGLLFGVLFLIPLWGAALGAAAGAISGLIIKHGVDKDFQDRVQAMLNGEDSAAVFMVIDEVTADKFVEALKPFGGDVLQTSLSFKDEEELKHALMAN